MSSERGEFDAYTDRRRLHTPPSCVEHEPDPAFIRRVVRAAGYVVETRRDPDDDWKRAGAFESADLAEAFEQTLPGQYPLHKRVRMEAA